MMRFCPASGFSVLEVVFAVGLLTVEHLLPTVSADQNEALRRRQRGKRKGQQFFLILSGGAYSDRGHDDRP
jgi:hypothetical protein